MNWLSYYSGWAFVISWMIMVAIFLASIYNHIDGYEPLANKENAPPAMGWRNFLLVCSLCLASAVCALSFLAFLAGFIIF